MKVYCIASPAKLGGWDNTLQGLLSRPPSSAGDAMQYNLNIELLWSIILLISLNNFEAKQTTMKTSVSRTDATNRFLQDTLDLFAGKATGNLWPYLYDGPRNEQDPVRGEILYNDLLRWEPKYYLYKLESTLLQTRSLEIANCIGSGATVFELGPGGEQSIRNKSYPFLRALPELKGYVAVDISPVFLEKGLRITQSLLPHIPVQGVCQNLTLLDSLPVSADKPLLFFKGSTIANLGTVKTRQLLERFHNILGNNGVLVVGQDANQDLESLMWAYDNSRFELFFSNIMYRIQRDLGTQGLEPEYFRGVVEWLPDTYDLQLSVVVLRDQTVQLEGHQFHLHEGQKLHIFSSHKYPVEVFSQLGRDAGFNPVAYFADDYQRMVIHVFRTTAV